MSRYITNYEQRRGSLHKLHGNTQLSQAIERRELAPWGALRPSTRPRTQSIIRNLKIIQLQTKS